MPQREYLTQQMKEIDLALDGYTEPHESPGYDAVMKEVINKINKSTNEGKKVRESEFEYGEPTDRSPSEDENGQSYPEKPDLLREFEQTVEKHKDEVKGVFGEVTFVQDVEDSPDEFREMTDTEATHKHIRIPFSWYRELRRSYRGKEVPYIDAIQILGFILFCYRMESIPNYIYRVRPQEFQTNFGINKDRSRKAIKYLENNDILSRIIVKGITPWYYRSDRTPGTYRYVILHPKEIRGITYNTGVRFKTR